jgi:hypothetical protein
MGRLAGSLRALKALTRLTVISVYARPRHENRVPGRGHIEVIRIVHQYGVQS